MSPLAKFIVGSVLVSAVYYAVTSPSQEKRDFITKRQFVAGWKQLDDCSPLQSLDGTRQLVLKPDHTVKLSGDPKSRADDGAANGMWAFDEANKRYFITIGAQQKSYTLVQPESSEVCILVRGELASADMREIWYSRTLEDLRDEAAEAE